MSYVVCCNTTNDEDLTTGNRQPNSFTNNFKSPLIVEPNSEVAVESVKINRSAQFDSKLRGRRFFLYWGPEQNDDPAGGAAIILNRDVSKTGVEINPNVAGSFSIRGYANEIQRAINIAPLAPNIYGNAEVTIQLDAATKEWKGFDYIYEQRTTQADGKAFLTTGAEGNYGTVQNRYDLNPDGTQDPIDYNVGAPQRFICNHPNTALGSADIATDYGSSCYCRVTNMVPLSPINGEADFQLTTVGGKLYEHSWTIGITRPASAYLNGGQPPQMPRTTPGGNSYYKGGINETYMDYLVHWDAIKELLFVREYCKNRKNGNTWQRRDITYWAGPKNFKNQANKAALDGVYDTVHFLLRGNEVNVGMRNGAGAVSWMVNPSLYASNAREECLRPTTNSTEWLVPAVALWEPSQQVDITTWLGINLEDQANLKNGAVVARFPTDLAPRRNSRNLPFPNPRLFQEGSDWGSYYQINDPDRLIHNDERYSQVGPAVADAADPFVYSTLIAGNLAEQYHIVMVVGQEDYEANVDEADQKLYVIPIPNHHANMSSELGYDGDLSVLEQDTFAAVIAPAPPVGQRIQFLSLNAGAFSIHSAFVRVNDLTIRSFNGATQSRSQILWHLPKFSNEGKQFGDLYFAPGEKTYIKLHNSHKETINQLSIDIVGRNEQVVHDLTGATIVVLHIRRCHSDLEENSHC